MFGYNFIHPAFNMSCHWLWSSDFCHYRSHWQHRCLPTSYRCSLTVVDYTCAMKCSSYLLPDKIRRVKQKTPVLKKNCNPTWNHTMVFENVSWEDLRDFCLELTIWDYDRFTSNDFLGGVRLNLGSGKWNNP